MSVTLLCPNCGAVVGEYDSNDNHQQKFYHKDSNGKPICNNCGTGAYELSTLGIIVWVVICVFILTALTLSAL